MPGQAKRHHLVVIQPAYIDLILSGAKTIECRLAQAARPPFARVRRGDTLWLKESCGPVRAVARAGRVESHRGLDSATLQTLRRRYDEAICGTDAFWAAHTRCRFATLIWLVNVRPVAPFSVHKPDRRAWVVLPHPPTADCLIPA